MSERAGGPTRALPAWLPADEEAVLAMLRNAVGAGPAGVPEIPGYQIVQVLGRGAQGTVYEAVQVADGARVALKVLDRRTFPTSRLARRLERELELVRRLEHPGIVRVLSSGRTPDGRPYLVQERLPGRTLRDVLPLGRQDGPCRNLPSLLLTFLDICAAVDHAHKRGVLHRDLKPGNILLDEEGRPRVADFGLAKEVTAGDDGPASDSGRPAAATLTGDILGSLAYAAPEQIGLVPGDVDVRSDVYSLGVILHEMLLGIPPVEAGGPLADVLRRLGEAKPLAPGRLYRQRRAAGWLPADAPPRLPRALDAILGKALAREKDARYQSVEELAADVRRFLQHRPVLARREGSLRRFLRHAGQHPYATGAFLLLLASLAVAAVQALHRARERERLYAWALESQRLILEDALGAFARLAGGGEARARLLAETLASFDRILAEYPGDPALRAGRALALIQEGMRQRDEGRAAEALARYQEALAELRDLTRLPDARPEWQRSLALVMVKIGDVHKEAGDHRAAGDWYRRALELHEALARKQPLDAETLDDLFWSYHRLGMLALLDDDRNGARQWLDRLAPLAERLEALAPGRPGNDLLRLEAARAWTDWWAPVDAEKSRQALEQAAAVARRMHLRAPEEGDPAARLAWILAGLCGKQLQAGLIQEARASLEEAQPLADALVAAEPRNLDLQGLRLLLLHLRLTLDARTGVLPSEEDLGRFLEARDAWLAATRARALDRVWFLGVAEQTARALAAAGAPDAAQAILRPVLEASPPRPPREAQRLEALLRSFAAEATEAGPTDGPAAALPGSRPGQADR